MTDDLRWAVRYAFLEDLWRDRARVIVDAGLEATLLDGGGPAATAAALDPMLVELVDALVPRRPRDRTWVGVTDEGVARTLTQTRPGTGFLPRADLAEVVARRDWAVAMVELAALDDETSGGTRLREELMARVDVERADGRVVVVSTPVRARDGDEPDGDEPDEDPDYAALAECLDELGGGRIYGMTRPAMAAMIDFGEPRDEEEDDEVPLTFDNTLGSQSPRFVEYVGIAGEVDELPEGMTLIELPESSDASASEAEASPPPSEPTDAVPRSASPTSSWATDESLRAQLAQAQRQVELAAIDRQALLERVDELESARAELEQQAVELRDHLARAVTEAPPEASLRAPGATDRLQAALADNQALRWSVRQLEHELELARARPVETLEAEVARLRAELASVAATSAEADAPTQIVRRAERVVTVSETATTLVLDELETALADAEADETLQADRGADRAADRGADALAQAKTEVQLDRRARGTGRGLDEVSETATTLVPGERPTVPLEVERTFVLDPGEPFEPISEAIDLAERRRFGDALRQLDRLVERVERGGIGALPLRQALVSLRRRLRS